VEANVYFHKTLIPPTPEIEHSEYAIWLRVEGKGIGDGKAEPFRQVYDRIRTYADRAELKLKEKSLLPELYDLSRRIEDEGIPVSNLPEFIGGYEEILPEDLDKYEMSGDEELILQLGAEVREAEKLKELNGYGY